MGDDGVRHVTPVAAGTERAAAIKAACRCGDPAKCGSAWHVLPRAAAVRAPRQQLSAWQLLWRLQRRRRIRHARRHLLVCIRPSGRSLNAGASARDKPPGRGARVRVCLRRRPRVRRLRMPDRMVGRGRRVQRCCDRPMRGHIVAGPAAPPR
eukprot:161258-Chlamydomonas_euryale.AAC.2